MLRVLGEQDGADREDLAAVFEDWRGDGGDEQRFLQMLVRRRLVRPAALGGLLAEVRWREQAGQLLDRYPIDRRLGAGGSGTVYRATDAVSGRPVALKIVSAGPRERLRFEREARAFARLDHPNILRVHHHGLIAGRLYLVLELVEGGTLEAALASAARRRLLGHMAEVARAADHAHERGVLHRDIKPANVLLTVDGRAKLADLGLARIQDEESGLTAEGQPIGTLAYMAPEQAEGRWSEIGPAIDVYGLGASLYHVLTGFPPHRGRSSSEVFLSILTRDPVPPRELDGSIPEPLDRLVRRALDRNPARRQASAAVVAEGLERSLAG